MGKYGKMSCKSHPRFMNSVKRFFYLRNYWFFYPWPTLSSCFLRVVTQDKDQHFYTLVFLVNLLNMLQKCN